MNTHAAPPGATGDTMTNTNDDTPGGAPRLYDAHAAGARIGVKAETIRRWANDGTIGYVRVGKRVMFTAEHIATYIAEHSVDRPPTP